MSKIALTGHASGTGTLTVAAPNTNTDSTLTLPDNGGTLLTKEFPAGTAAAPSITPLGDTDTGLFSSALNTLSLSTGGVERVTVDSSGRMLRPNQPTFQGGFGGVGPGTFTNQTMTVATIRNNGFTVTGGTQLVVPVTGQYFIHGQQLTQAGTNPDYFELRINGATIKHAYMVGSSFRDLLVSYIGLLNANDYIEFRHTAISQAWADAHSSLCVFLI